MKTQSKKLPAIFNLPIEWTDEDWAKPLVVRRTKKPYGSLHSAVSRNGLAHRCATARRSHRAFTLIEMLVVIGIIAILASILVPVLATAKKSSKITASRTDMKNIESAVSSYQATYTLAPVPKPNPYNPPDATDFSFTQTNSDIVAILMDQDRLANTAHARNPQKQSFLNATVKPGTSSQGVSSDDYNFRDPWGKPYVIAFDLDYDNKVDVPNDPVFGANYPYRNIPRGVIVWSFGPDGKAGPGNAGENKDNIKSWE